MRAVAAGCLAVVSAGLVYFVALGVLHR